MVINTPRTKKGGAKNVYLEDVSNTTSRPAMESRRVRLYLLMLLADAAVLLGSFLVSGGIYRDQWPNEIAMAMGWAFLPIFLVIAVYQRCYSIRALDEARYAIEQVGIALILSAMLCAVMIFYAKAATEFSRVMFSLALTLAFLGMALFRFAMRMILRRVYGPSVSSVLVVMDGGPRVRIRDARVVRAEDFDISGVQSSPNSLDRIGRLMRGMDRVVVSCSVDQRIKWASVMRGAGVRGEVISSALQELGAIALSREEGQSFLVVSTGPLALHARIFKRATDLAIAIPALILLSPILIVVAALIKIEDGGPVLFVQERMGAHNCLFKMFKFRSMRVDRGDERGARSTSRDDDRVTRVGAFIRKTSIDELPQLLNVLRSEMSIVGPRPHALGSQAGQKLFWEIDRNYWQRHALKPGLTGLAQVRGYRGATETEAHLLDRLDSDLEYIRSWSLWRDIKIIFATIGVLMHANAY